MALASCTPLVLSRQFKFDPLDIRGPAKQPRLLPINATLKTYQLRLDLGRTVLALLQNSDGADSH